MSEWLNWVISLFQTAVLWLSQMKIFNVPLIAILGGIILMGVLLRALLYKA